MAPRIRYLQHSEMMMEVNVELVESCSVLWVLGNWDRQASD